jgi:hypothetical protein
VGKVEEIMQTFPLQSKLQIMVIAKKVRTARINQEIMKIEMVITTGLQDLAAKTKSKTSVKMAQQMFRYLQISRKAVKDPTTESNLLR